MSARKSTFDSWFYTICIVLLMIFLANLLAKVEEFNPPVPATPPPNCGPAFFHPVPSDNPDVIV